MPADLASLVDGKRILLCVGAGGVGKTTTAAALGLAAARRGRRALVITIDPARRLASSLGLPRLDQEIRRVPDDTLAEAGVRLAPGGALSAMMLDQKRTFDELVTRYARAPGDRERILASRIYQQISTTLTGAHEYAAMAKLQELERDRAFDTIVVDTPPTAHALDFLDAPDKVAGAVDSPAVEWFRRSLRATGRFSLRLAGASGAFVLRRIARFTGAGFLEDIAHFLVDFNEVLGGFRQRAEEVYRLLRGPEVAFLLVAAPEPTALEEAIYLRDKLLASEMPFSGVIVNRVHVAAPAAPPAGELARRLGAEPSLAGFPPYDLARAADDLGAADRAVAVLADADGIALARLRQALPVELPVVEVPLFDADVHDVRALGTLGAYLATWSSS